MREMAKLFAIRTFFLLLAFPVVAEENKDHKNDLKIPPKSIEKYHEKITIVEKNIEEQALPRPQKATTLVTTFWDY
jgi:hypothetical protein